MIKTIITTALMLLLCSCEIFGWDSAGGNNGDPESVTSDDELIEIASLYYIDVPMGYPNAGSTPPTESAGGSQIAVSGFKDQARSVVLSEENALILTQAACDSTATTIMNINFEESETTVSWQNSSLSLGSLSLSNDEVSDPPLQLITCIN